MFGYKSQLEDLERTVSTIKAVFEVANRKKNISPVEQQLIQELKDAVYEADDLLDEFLTLAQQKLQLDVDSSSSLSKKLRNFFSLSKNNLGVAYKMSTGVKNIRKKLDAIVDNNRFNFVHDPEPIRKRRPETCSYVNEVEIIGRGDDLEKIVGTLLLDSEHVNQDLTFFSIFGIGGLGKTALAQLVFNDSRVKTAFPLRLWTCVSDQDQDQLDVKEVLCKILASVTNRSHDEGLTLDQVQSKLRQELVGKKYFLVLDDVWNEDREAWCGLAQYFVGGQRGCCIMVTTRSERTAMIVGDKPCQMYKLQGLSKKDSWRLFERTAFGSDESNPPDEDLIKLGRAIVEGCARVPLAIRVVGSLLYRQDKSKWLSVKEIGFSDISKNEDGIMSILQLSYHHLQSFLKSCFTYCAIFPKDFEINKQMLIDLWMVQGYVVPLYDGQSVEDASEEYFSILLKRCFFQDIQKDDFGEIWSCKMHDLIHDLAQSVSRKEIHVANIINGANIYEKVRHLSCPASEYRKHSLKTAHIRSYIHMGGNCWYNEVKVENSFMEALIASCVGLRALDLAGLEMKSLPESIGTLLHLRYLNLSHNTNLEVLPKSISKLYNLETLKLYRCQYLKELPKELSRLVKLRVLNISFCDKLNYMPKGMEKLTSLKTLTNFIVGNEGRFVSWKQWFEGMQDRKAPNNLKGELLVDIKWPINAANNVVPKFSIEKGSMIIRSTEHLNLILIDFKNNEGDGIHDEVSIAVMEYLHPHPNLKILQVFGYVGTRMPDWVFLLPNLVELWLCYCKNLKQWSSSGLQSVPTPCLPQLKKLKIYDCPELTWIPLCPKLEILDISNFNKALVIGEVASPIESTFKEITIDNAAWLNSQPMKAFQCLVRLEIIGDKKIESLGVVEEVFRSCYSSLRRLKIRLCKKLSVVGEGLEHLIALEELKVRDCKNLKGRSISIPCQCPSLLPSLHTLKLRSLTKLENLPNWMQFLPSLQTLKIVGCEQLKEMPNWMSKLTSLKHLHILSCSESIKRRCEGEDWPFIQHIPDIKF